MRDDELRALLMAVNPWWRAAASGSDPQAWTAHDRLLLDRSHHDLGYRPRALADLAVGPVGDTLTVLRGPRRVGKSVVLKDLAAALCGRSDVDARQIVYVPCDGFTTRDLTRSLVVARDLTRSVDVDRNRRRVWLLDEIGGVRGWTAPLKSARDNTAFGDDTVVVTSSSWRRDEDVEGHLLAGRAGSSGLRRLRLLLPMTFRDYVAAARPEVPLPATVHPADLQSVAVRRELDVLQFEVDAFDLAWQTYLTCGGFPRAVAEQERLGAVSNDYLRDLAASLRDDVDPDAPAHSLPRLLGGIEARSSSPLERVGVARELGYSSREVFERRLNRSLWRVLRTTSKRVVGSLVTRSATRGQDRAMRLIWPR